MRDGIITVSKTSQIKKSVYIASTLLLSMVCKGRGEGGGGGGEVRVVQRRLREMFSKKKNIEANKHLAIAMKGKSFMLHFFQSIMFPVIK